MAQQFYQRKVQESAKANSTPVAGPDLSQAYKAVDLKKQQMTDAINGLLSAGNGAIAVYDQAVTKPTMEKEKALGQELANKASTLKRAANDINSTPDQRANAQRELEAIESQGTEFSWIAGNARRDAYENLVAENSVMEMPDAYMSHRQRLAQEAMNDPNSKIKSLDDMTPEERRMDYINFRSQYFKDTGIDGKPYSAKASVMSDTIMNKHLELLGKQAADIRNQKAKNAVALNSATVIEAFQGDPKRADAELNAKMSVWAEAAGGQAQANEAVVNGLMRAASGLDDPEGRPNAAALLYLKSPEARARFGGMQGFDTAVKQATVNSSKFVEQEKRKLHAALVQDFHGNLITNSFQNEKEVMEYFESGNGKGFDNKEAFTLRNKALKYVRSQQAAINLEESYVLKRTGEINAAPKAVRDQLFGMKVGVFGKDMTVGNMTKEQLDGVADWVRSGFTPPEPLVEFANTYPSYDDARGKQVMAKQLDYYRYMNSVMGDQVNQVFTDVKVRGRLELFNTLEGSTMSDGEKSKVMREYEQAFTPGSFAYNLERQVARELKDDDKLSKKIMSFAKSGSDTQPFFNFSNNDSASYASNRITNTYKAYRAAGMDEKKAFDKASSDFDKDHKWVEWDDGTNTYLPNRLGFSDTDEYGYSVQNQIKNFLQKEMVIDDIAINTGDHPDDVRRDISVRPDTVNSGDVLTVYYKGSYTNIKFTPEQLNGSNASAIYDERKRNEIKSKYDLIYKTVTDEDKKRKVLQLKRLGGTYR